MVIRLHLQQVSFSRGPQTRRTTGHTTCVTLSLCLFEIWLVEDKFGIVVENQFAFGVGSGRSARRWDHKNTQMREIETEGILVIPLVKCKCELHNGDRTTEPFEV